MLSLRNIRAHISVAEAIVGVEAHLASKGLPLLVKGGGLLLPKVSEVIIAINWPTLTPKALSNHLASLIV